MPAFVHETGLFRATDHPWVKGPRLQTQLVYIRGGKQVVDPQPQGLGTQSTVEICVLTDVDPDTGKITLKNCVTAHDCGQVINPLGVEGQLEGAIAMAAGYGFTEDLPMDEGKILNPNLVDYMLLRATEMPETKDGWL